MGSGRVLFLWGYHQSKRSSPPGDQFAADCHLNVVPGSPATRKSTRTMIPDQPEITLWKSSSRATPEAAACDAEGGAVRPQRREWPVRRKACSCQFRLKIPRCAGRKFPTPEPHEWASLASDGVEPSAVFWRVLGVTESEAKERAAASAPSCPRGGTRPALRRSFNR